MRRNTTSGRRAASSQRATTPQASQATDQLTERLASIEQLVQAQQARITEQERELTQLRTALAASGAAAAPTAPAAKPKDAVMQTSRRALLMAGGTVAAIAAFEVATSHAPIAQAHGANAAGAAKAETGITWQTGTVSADQETLVQPSSSGYPSNDMLQVRLGTGTVYQPAALKAAVTAYDTTTNNIGVYATSSTGYGLYGVTDSGAGATGAGLSGTANTGTGVAGISTAGIAVSGASTNGLGASFSGGQAPIALALGSGTGAPTGGGHVSGEIFADANGELWVCVSPGTPGSWTKLAHLAPDVATGGAVTYLTNPIRLLDTRSGEPALNQPKAPYAAGSTHTIQIAGDFYNTVQVPYSCAGAIGNLTVIGKAGNGGYAALVPSGAGFTGTANLAFNAGQVVSNAYNVGLSAGGALDIILGPAASADVILDLFAIVS